MLTCALHNSRRFSLAIPVLLLFMLLAGCVRGYRLDFLSLQPDEAFSWRLIQYSPEELLQRTAADVHPPLYYLLLQAWVRCWGDSIVALRSLSVILGVLSLPILYLLCVEASLRLGEGWYSASPSARTGALFATALLAVQAGQVMAAQWARMYSLGVLLAGLTAWLLLRALRAHRGRWWWLGYGLAASAFCYTHYYAFFTILAQVLFVAAELMLRLRRQPFRSVVRTGAGFLSAGGLALLLYLPWFPVWLDQTSAVWRNFWIPAVTANQFANDFFSWSAGTGYQDLWAGRLWLVLLAGCTLWMLARADRGGCFLLLQAIVPWLASLAISTWSGRPLFVERYLIFAQFFLLAFWGLVWTRLPGRPERLFLGVLVVTPILHGLWNRGAYEPTRPPALALAASFLKRSYQPEDVIWTNNAVAVNSLRYYAARAGLLDLHIQCPFPPSAAVGGHIPHVASLPPEEILPEKGEITRPLSRRVWRGSPSNLWANEPIAGMQKVREHTFQGGDGGLYTLVQFEQQK